MREILFRGKTQDGKWILGSLINCKNVIGGIVSKYDLITEPYLIEQKTIGQYTGLTDKNGTKIFEGDIVRAISLPTMVGRISWGSYYDSDEGIDGYGWFIWSDNAMDTFCYSFTLEKSIDLEIVGNIHDNPELLNEVSCNETN